MKPEERVRLFDNAWELIKQADFHKQGQAVQILMKLTCMQDDHATGLVGRLIILNYFSNHPEKEQIKKLFYSSIYDWWINSRQAQVFIAQYTLIDALKFLIRAEQKNPLLTPILKKLAITLKGEIDYNEQLDVYLNPYFEAGLTEKRASPPNGLFAEPRTQQPSDSPLRSTAEPRHCACSLI